MKKERKKNAMSNVCAQLWYINAKLYKQNAFRKSILLHLQSLRVENVK